MRTGHFIALGGAALATAMALSSLPSAAASERVNPFAARLLAAHNGERQQVGAERLQWSGKLARDAQKWADHLARRGTLEHASYEAREKAGENLWMGTAGYYSAETMIAGFLAEKKDFRPGTFPHVSRTGRWQDVAHYTQIIWHDTREVGCAVSRGKANDFLVCRYLPTGNWIGQKIGQ